MINIDKLQPHGTVFLWIQHITFFLVADNAPRGYKGVHGQDIRSDFDKFTASGLFKLIQECVRIC